MGGPRPSAAALRALDADAWSALLAVALPVVRQLPERHLDRTVKRLRSLQVGRLVSGRSRAELADVLVREPVWALVEAALPEDADRPWLDAPGAGDAPDTAEAAAVARDRDALQQRVVHLERREESLDQRLRQTRAELEELRRTAEGAVARAATAERAAEQLAAERDEQRRRAQELTDTLAAAEADRARVLARADRRATAEQRDRDEQLREARREVDVLRREVAALRERLAAADAATVGTADEVAEEEPERTGGHRGRPSTLPPGVAAGTQEAARWLVGAGRVLLVDGYNVTKSLRPEVPLTEQRRWLEQAVATLSQRRHVDATIIWDSAVGGGTSARHHSGLTVRFTEPDRIADDDLVLHVQMALDPDTPVVAVTDDRELRDRLRSLGVDLLDTRSFGWLL